MDFDGLLNILSAYAPDHKQLRKRFQTVLSDPDFSASWRALSGCGQKRCCWIPPDDFRKRANCLR